jgi:hypothetical protein
MLPSRQKKLSWCSNFVVHSGGTQTMTRTFERPYFAGFLTIRLSRLGNPSLSATRLRLRFGAASRDEAQGKRVPRHS